MRRCKFWFLLPLLGATFASAENSPWVDIFETHDHSKFHIKRGSVKVVNGYKDMMFVEAVVRITFSDLNSPIVLQKWRVSKAHCKAQMGKVYVTRIDGTTTGELEFVFDGGNAASAVAQVLCMIGEADAASTRKH